MENHPVFEQDDFVMNNIYQVNRIRRDGRTNLCYEKTYINADLVPNLPDYISENVSIYDLYENQYNLQLDSGIFNLEAINANKQIANILNIKDNSPLLYMTAFVKTVDGTPLYHVQAYYVGSKYIFSTQLKR